MNLGQLVAEIESDLGHATETAAVKSAIRTSIETFKDDRWRFNEFRLDLTTVANQEAYIEDNASFYPGGDSVSFSRIFDIHFVRSNQQSSTIRSKFELVDWGEYQERSSVEGVTATVPEIGSIFGPELFIYPLPSAAYTLSMFVTYDIQNVTSSSLDAETNPMIEEYPDLVKFRALEILWRTHIKKSDLADNAAVVWTDFYKRARGREFRRKGGGSMKVRPKL